MEISASLSETISGMRSLADVVTNLSTAGIAAVILTWARILGVYKDADFSSFRRPLLLIVPLASFLTAVICGYALNSALTGFFHEVTLGMSTQGIKMSDPTVYYKCEFGIFNLFGGLQLLASVIGIVTLSGWFLWNVRHKLLPQPPSQ